MNTAETNLAGFPTPMFPISHPALDESLLGFDLETFDFSTLLEIDSSGVNDIIEQETNKQHQPDQLQFLTPESTFNESANFNLDDSDLIDLNLLGFDFMSMPTLDSIDQKIDQQDIQCLIDSPTDPTVNELSMLLSDCVPSVENDDESSQFSFSSHSESKQDASSPMSTSTDGIKRVKSRARVDKKESNKAAAIRYRTKKLKEKDELFRECELYAKKNGELKKKIDDLQTEISFIKSLLVEALIKKNKSA